jgi:hypothetical protein
VNVLVKVMREKMSRRKKFNPFNKIQLSILNSGLIHIEPDVGKAGKLLPKKPMDFLKFNHHIHLIRKYEVLFKIELQVSLSFHP